MTVSIHNKCKDNARSDRPRNEYYSVSLALKQQHLFDLSCILWIDRGITREEEARAGRLRNCEYFLFTNPNWLRVDVQARDEPPTIPFADLEE